MKYIIIEKPEFGMEMAILFDVLIKHSAVAAGKKVVSAGFVMFSSVGPVAYGASDGLNLVSRPQDSAIIKESMERKTVI